MLPNEPFRDVEAQVDDNGLLKKQKSISTKRYIFALCMFLANTALAVYDSNLFLSTTSNQVLTVLLALAPIGPVAWLLKPNIATGFFALIGGCFWYGWALGQMAWTTNNVTAEALVGTVALNVLVVRAEPILATRISATISAAVFIVLSIETQEFPLRIVVGGGISILLILWDFVSPRNSSFMKTLPFSSHEYFHDEYASKSRSTKSLSSNFVSSPSRWNTLKSFSKSAIISATPKTKTPPKDLKPACNDDLESAIDFAEQQSLNDTLTLAVEDANTEEVREEIELAKGNVETRFPGTLSRLEAMKIPFESLTFHERIGNGSFGEVYRATWISKPDREVRTVAVKRVPRHSVTRQKVASMLTEIDVVSGSAHPNIIRTMGWCDEPYVLVVLEYANGGSLRDYLASQSSRLEPGWVHEKTRLAIDAAAGISYLHGRGVLHRDIKADNMLVACYGDSSRTVKVGDFGSAMLGGSFSSKKNNKPVVPLQRQDSVAGGSPYWIAPEIARGALTFDDRADVWSFGVLLCEMVSHEMPYVNLQTGDSYFSMIGLAQGNINPATQLEGLVPMGARDTVDLRRLVRLVEKCCAYLPQDRPSMRNVMFELLQMIVDDSSTDSDGSMDRSRENTQGEKQPLRVKSYQPPKTQRRAVEEPVFAREINSANAASGPLSTSIVTGGDPLDTPPGLAVQGRTSDPTSARRRLAFSPRD